VKGQEGKLRKSNVNPDVKSGDQNVSGYWRLKFPKENIAEILATSRVLGGRWADKEIFSS